MITGASNKHNGEVLLHRARWLEVRAALKCLLAPLLPRPLLRCHQLARATSARPPQEATRGSNPDTSTWALPLSTVAQGRACCRARAWGQDGTGGLRPGGDELAVPGAR